MNSTGIQKTNQFFYVVCEYIALFSQSYEKWVKGFKYTNPLISNAAIEHPSTNQRKVGIFPIYP
jgi:hypothetical protein